MTTQALIPQFVAKSKNQWAANILAVMSGVLLITLLAQMKIMLPWTPVPISGQTFGVALVALSWGQKRALSSMICYLGLGVMGLPVFAAASVGPLLGPTFGYLIGMGVASFVVGTLADKGWTNTYGRSLAAAYIGSICVFSFGLLGLSFFVPGKALLAAGLIPFIPGDTIKNILAASLSCKLKKSLFSQS